MIRRFHRRFWAARGRAWPRRFWPRARTARRPRPQLATSRCSAAARRGAACTPAPPGQALAGLQWRFMTEGDVISSPTVARADACTSAAATAVCTRSIANAGHEEVGVRRRQSDSVVARGWRWRRLLRHARRALLRRRRSDRQTAMEVRDRARSCRGRGDTRAATSTRRRPRSSTGRVYFGAGDGRVYAVDAATGQGEVARADAGTRSRLARRRRVARLRRLGRRSRVRVRPRDRRAKWKFDTEGVKLNSGDFGYDRRTVQSSPTVSNGTVFVGARDGWIYAIDAATGAEKWRFDHKISWINTSPAVLDGVVYAGSSDAQFVQALDAATGKELWRTTTGTTWSSPAVAGDVVYAGDGAGRLHALDRKTGKLLWSFRTGQHGALVADAVRRSRVRRQHGRRRVRAPRGDDAGPARGVLRLGVHQVGVDA